MSEASDSICEVCGDAGGALSLVICENTDLGCLGGIHLYCCIPLCTEAPADAWYCSECSTARAAIVRDAVARVAVQRAEREAQRQARKRRRQEEAAVRKLAQQQARMEQRTAVAAMHQQQEQHGPDAAQPLQQQQVLQKQPQQPQQKPLEEQQQQQQQQQRQFAPAAQQQQQQRTAAARPLQQHHAGQPVGKPAAPVPRKSSTLALEVAAMGRACAKAPARRGAATPQQQQRALAGAQASSSLPITPASRVASTDTLAYLFGTMDRDDEASQEAQRRMRNVLDGTSRSMQRNLSEREEWLQDERRRHTLAACRLEGLRWQGWLHIPAAHQVEGHTSWAARMDAYSLPGKPRSAEAVQWLVTLAQAAVAGQQPAPYLLPMDELGIVQDRAFQQACLLLAPGQCDAVHQTMHTHHWQALWHLLRGQATGKPMAGVLTIPPAAVAAARGAGALGGWEGSTDGLFLAVVPNLLDPNSRTLLGLLAVPMHLLARAPAKGHAPARGILARTAARSPPPTLATRNGSSSNGDSDGKGRRAAGVGWADAPATAAAAAVGEALELELGSHYATPRRRAVLASRPARLPHLRAFEASPGGPGVDEVPPQPLQGLRVALPGFGTGHEKAVRVASDLRALGALTFTNQASLADILMLNPTAVATGLDSFSGRVPMFPMGLAHLMATSAVRVCVDGNFEALRRMVGLQRQLTDAEWALHRPVFPGGLMVVLDAPTLLSMHPAELAEALLLVERLRAAAEEQRWVWAVASAPPDLADLQAAAEAGQVPAADNWRLWRGSSVARPLAFDEGSGSSDPRDPGCAVKHAVKTAKARMAHCRLVFLCTSVPETLSQAENKSTILCGGPQDLLDFLRDCS